MLDRRSVLRGGAGVLGTATLASAAGCFFSTESGSSSSSDSFLGPLPDPMPDVVPNFHCAYGFDPATLRDELGADPMPQLAGELIAIVGEMEGIAVDDVYRLSGQTIRQVGHSGGDFAIVTPRGTDLVVEGSIDVGGAANWLASRDSFTDLGDDQGYRRFGHGGQVVQGFVADGDAFAFGSREATGLSPDGLATAAIEGIEDDAVPAAETSPELVATVDALPSGTATVATAFDLVAERPDTGTEAYDATASSLLAAGVSATVNGETTDVTRLLRYRRGRVASVDVVQSAVDAAIAAEQFNEADWTVSASGRSVRIEGSVPTATVASAPETLRRAVPVPAFEDLAVPVDPSELGRDAPPRAAWQLSVLDDGRVAIVHGDGPTVEDLTVAYTVDGERVREQWAGPVEPEDRFETSQVPDGGSVVDLVWARGTANETILTRAELG